MSDQVEIHQSDVSRPSSGSSSFGESHLTDTSFCIKCRGSECDVNSRCDECFSWTKEETEGHVRLCKSLSSKSKKNKTPLKASTSPPRSTASNLDLDTRLVNKSMDEKLNVMSFALMSQFTSMLDEFKLGFNNFFFRQSWGTGAMC